MSTLQSVLSVFLASVFFLNVRADTPANCTFEDIVGSWLFHEGPRGQNSAIDCSNPDNLDHNRKIDLLFPNIAVDEHGTRGTWTLIYNQGFEVKIGFRSYFAFSDYIAYYHHSVLSLCNQTRPGWSHDLYSRDWSCFRGTKLSPGGDKLRELVVGTGEDVQHSQKKFKNNQQFIGKINQAQKSWKAVAYPEFEELTRDELRLQLGGPASYVAKAPKPAESVSLSPEEVAAVSSLPSEFDWRNVDGQNFMSPVRNQGACGSCYAFASMGMMEARYRIATNNTQTPIFSPMDIVQCSVYSQGCLGGFPYLIAGKYAMDYGLVLEECNPYSQPEMTAKCKTTPKCRRFYAANYRYIGDYYGGCNEDLMKLALVRNGPLAVSFEVYDDFVHYKSGVYHHTGLKDNANQLAKWNPFQIANHAVLLVGYGVDKQTKEPYWSVKNSWGARWGDNGYFRIHRGSDECSIENSAVEATPIPTY